MTHHSCWNYSAIIVANVTLMSLDTNFGQMNWQAESLYSIYTVVVLLSYCQSGLVADPGDG